MMRKTILLVALLLALHAETSDSKVSKTKVLVKLVDTFFDIYNLLSGGGEDNEKKLHEKLIILENRMAEYFKHQEFKIDGLTTANQLATTNKNIDSCYQDFINFITFRTPAEEKRVIECGSKVIPDIRQVAKIGTEKLIYPFSHKIFEDRIKHDRLCRAEILEPIFNFLIGLIVKGCQPAIMSERILHNGTSQVILNECKSNVINMETHYASILSKCYVYDTCELMEKSVKTAISRTKGNVDLLAIALNKQFPWYNFIIIAAYDNSKVTFDGHGDKPSIASIPEGKIRLSVIWTPFHVQSRDNSSFKVSIDQKKLFRLHLGMNVTEETIGDNLVISGHIVRGNSSEADYKRCDINFGTKTICQPNLIYLFVFVLTFFILK